MVAVESTIDRVVLYNQGATVIRRIELKGEESFPDRIEVVALPLALRDASTRVRVDSEHLEASDIQVALFVAPRETLNPSEDEARLKTVHRELALQDDLITQIQTEQGLLAKMRLLNRPEPEKGKPPPPSPMAARLALEAFTQQATEMREAEIQTLRDAVQALKDERTDLQHRLSQASQAKQVKVHEVTKQVKIRLTQKEPTQNAVLWLEYFVLSARWAPAYRCRLSNQGASTEIEQRALVCQKTGEDWQGVKLSLSTAHPLSWTELPELSSLHIGRAQPPSPPRRGFRPPPIGAHQLFDDYDRSTRSRT